MRSFPHFPMLFALLLNAALLMKPAQADPPPEVTTATLRDDPLPPLASGNSPVPAIHGPRVVGATPGHPFLFLIPATGEAPLTFAAENLPARLTLDAQTGIISGAIEREGEFKVRFSVAGPKGKTARALKIVAGQHKLALTPPMGWNSWNVWGDKIDEAKVRAAADAMIASGLAAHGYQYICIDDTWQAKRDSGGEILPNEKFGDMKALADYIHAKGLKFGIYSSPGPLTCGAYTGSYQHEEQDARTWARWGVDYIKYDWCTYSRIAKDKSLPELQRPYIVMRGALDKCGRDIVYSLCQYGMGNVWEWGADVGGNLWRTTGDIQDQWPHMSGIGFETNGPPDTIGPGHWNDPDMLVVGKLGYAWGKSLEPTRLTPNEQVTHITLWCMQAAPLMIGCDLTQLDKLTLDLLTNEEVLEIDQDPLGRQGSRVHKEGDLEIWARPLWDGTRAIALFNRGVSKSKISVDWPTLGLKGEQPVRDLWRQKDLGIFKDAFSAEVNAHGAVLVKIGQPKPEE